MAMREWGHLLLLIAVATSLRFPGLETLSFYGDEELSALAVQGILSAGYPHMPSGMGYWRGLPYSYMAAGSAILFGMSEFAVRLPSAFFGVLTIPAFYALAKRLIGQIPALLAAWLLVFSAWHIDMAREGRMYAVFLFFFLASLLFFEKGFTQNRRVCMAFSILAAIQALMLHDLGILILGYWWLSALLKGMDKKQTMNKKQSFLIASSLALGLWGVGYRRVFKFFFPGVGLNVTSDGGGPFAFLQTFHLQYFPKMGVLGHLLDNHPILFLLLCLGGITGLLFCLRHAGRKPGRANIGPMVLAGASTVAGILNLFGLIFLGWMALLLYRVGEREDWWGEGMKPMRKMALQISLLFIFWFLYGIFLWQGGTPGLSQAALIKKLAKETLFYPAWHIQAYLDSFPVMTLFICLGSALWVFSRFPEGKEPESLKLLLIWFWLPLGALGFSREWIELRYSLPVYPFYIMIFSWMLYRFGIWGIHSTGKLALESAPYMKRHVNSILTIAFLTLLLFPVIAEHHGIRPALATSRLSYGQQIPSSFHGFPFHPDHRGAGLYVRARLGAGDTVVALDAQQQKYYAGRVDYWLREARDAARYSRRQGEVQRDIYVGAIVIASLQELQNLVSSKHHGRIWLITSGELTASLAYLMPGGLQEFLAERRQQLVFTGRDGETRVYLFPPEELAPEKRPRLDT